MCQVLDSTSESETGVTGKWGRMDEYVAGDWMGKVHAPSSGKVPTYCIVLVMM